MITSSRETGYVLNKVVGQVTIGELLEYAQKNMDTWISDHVLWDLSQASMKADGSSYVAVEQAIRNIHDLAQKREDRKTAFATPNSYAYGMLRMAITIVEYYESHYIATVFYDVDEAVAWLLDPESEP